MKADESPDPQRPRTTLATASRRLRRWIREALARGVSALAISLIFHGLVALALIAYFEYAPEPDVLATLDLSSVELSFAEKDEVTAAVAPSLPTPSVRRPPKPKVDEKPAAAKVETPAPPEAGEVRLPEPKEDMRLKTEDVKDARRETRDVEAVSAPPAAPRQAKLDAPPRPRRNIRPNYPKGARQRGEQGDVVLEIRVNAGGAVDDVKVAVSSGFAELDEAAVKAARAAKFTPARSGHEPVASTARLKLCFKLK